MAKTVRVKIAVAVDNTGACSVCVAADGGAMGADDTGAIVIAHRRLRQQDSKGSDLAHHFVEADIPLPEKPEPLTIEGTVVT